MAKSYRPTATSRMSDGSTVSYPRSSEYRRFVAQANREMAYKVDKSTGRVSFPNAKPGSYTSDLASKSFTVNGAISKLGSLAKQYRNLFNFNRGGATVGVSDDDRASYYSYLHGIALKYQQQLIRRRDWRLTRRRDRNK